MQLQILLTILVLLQVTNTFCLVRIRRTEIDDRQENFIECKKQFGVTDEIIETTVDYWQDDKLKCFLACIFEKDELWNADKEFNINQFMEEFAEDAELQPKKAAIMKEVCFEEAKIYDDKCDFANTLFKCCIENFENYETKGRKGSKKAFSERLLWMDD